jgi:hypothetical protein
MRGGVQRKVCYYKQKEKWEEKMEKKNARMERKWRHVTVVYIESSRVHEYWCFSCAIW